MAYPMLIAAIAIQTTRSPQNPVVPAAIPLIGMPRAIEPSATTGTTLSCFDVSAGGGRHLSEPGVHAGIDLLADPLHKGVDNCVPVLGGQFVMGLCSRAKLPSGQRWISHNTSYSAPYREQANHRLLCGTPAAQDPPQITQQGAGLRATTAPSEPRTHSSRHGARSRPWTGANCPLLSRPRGAGR